MHFAKLSLGNTYTEILARPLGSHGGASQCIANATQSSPGRTAGA